MLRIEQYHCCFKPLKDRHSLETFARGIYLLQTLGIHYWIDAGTLLGLYRDGQLIPHDSDIDVSTDQKEKALEIETAFVRNGFNLIRRVTDGNETVQLAFEDVEYCRVIFDIEFYKKVGDEWLRDSESGTLVLPDKFYKAMAPRQFKLGVFNCPEPIEEYLELRYGNGWKVPYEVKTPWQDYTFNLRKPI